MRIIFLWVLAIGFILSSAGVSVAHHTNGGNGNNPNNNAAPPAPPASQPSAPPTQLSIDDTALKAAADDLIKDQQALQAIHDAAWQNYDQTDQWTALQTKLSGAQADLDTAKQASKDALTNNSDYQDALAAKKKASDDLDAAKASGETDPDQIGPLAQANLQATLNLRKIENDVQANDTGVDSAKEKLEYAQHDVDMAKMRFEQRLSLDRNYAAAKATVAAAQNRYDALHSKVTADNGPGSDN